VLPLLRDADVCAAAGCRPARRLGAASSDGPVRLTPDAGRDLYLRLPDRPAVDLDVAATDATLRIDVVADGIDETGAVTERVRGGGRVHVDLGPLAGRVARLALRVVAGDAVDVSAARVTGDEPLDAAPLVRPALAPGARPNVVVYVIDTLRADHVGCYGYARPTTPRIDEFARSAIRFAAATAESSWTLPTVASILTGLRPERHGAVDPDHAVRPDVPTLASLLAARGWSTAAFVTNYLGGDVFGLKRGFAAYRFYPERGARRRAVYLRSDAVFRRVARWLARTPPAPFLLYVHVTDPHFPYVPPVRAARAVLPMPPSAGAMDALTERLRELHNGHDRWGARPAPAAPADVALGRDLYDGEIRFADEYFGRLLDLLRARRVLDDSVIVLTSDHGEEFLEHGGVGHGQTLHREVLHVPMLLRLPGGAGGGVRVDRPVRQTDVLPTLLDVAGVPPPPGLDGISWLASQPSAARAEAPAMLILGRFEQQAVTAGRWKAIRDFARPAGDRVALFDTVADPAELRDLAATSPLLLGYARARLRELAVPAPPGPRLPADDRVERLRALGYVE
jgi:arylsulfatase A-like enzyme